MTVTIAPELEVALAEEARRDGKTPEDIVLEAVREKLALAPENTKGYDLEPRDEWERRILGIGVHTGVSLSDEAVSSEGIYQDHD
ncbi:MAG: hypothetical protein ACR2H5_02365 [Ktedonobacteraceae bacterium]